MSHYAEIRKGYKPTRVDWLFIAESPPPHHTIPSGRHFYRADYHADDRLFVNTIKALYTEAADKTEEEIGSEKEKWLRRLQAGGVYVIEALEKSLQKKVTKQERQQLIKDALPRLVERVGELTNPDTKIILIKSNVFEVAAQPLKAAGFTVLNQALVDYPGRFNQRAYREKVSNLMRSADWAS